MLGDKVAFCFPSHVSPLRYMESPYQLWECLM